MLIRKVRERGCVSMRHRGLHQISRCGSCRTVIPVHAGGLTPGMLRSIERDLEPCLGPKWLTK